MVVRLGVAALAALALVAWAGPYPANAQTPAAAPTQTAALPPAPPPRTISDLTAALGQFKAPDAAKVEADMRLADAPIPPDLAGAKRVDALVARALAAGRLGRLKRQLDDLREAMDLVETVPYEDKGGVVFALSIAEGVAGNLKQAIAYREKAIAMIPSNHAGRVAPWTANFAVLLAYSGDIARSEAQYAKAEAALEEQRKWRGFRDWGNAWTAMVLRAKATILDLRGKHAEADQDYATAIQLIEKQIESGVKDAGAAAPPRHDLLRDVTLAERAMVLIRLNRTIDAEILARRAVANRLADSGKFSLETAFALQKLAVTIAEQGRTEEAAALARAAIEIYGAAGAAKGSVYAATARALLAGTLANRGRWKEALAEYRAIRDALAETPDIYDARFGADVAVAVAELKAGDKTLAREIAAKGAERTAKRLPPRHYKVAEANAVLAMALAATGDKKGALERFRASVPVLIQRSRQSGSDETTQASNDRLRQLILEAYIDLLFDVSGTPLEQEAKLDAVGEAFRAADVARGQSVQKALAASAARASVADPALADLLRREQDAEKQIAALNGLLVNLMAAPQDQRDPKAVESLRAAIDKLRDERGALASEIEKRFPDYAELVNPKPGTLAEVQAALKPGEALIATYSGERRSYVWAVAAGGKPAAAAVALSREEIADKVALLRSALDPSASTVEEIPAFDLAAAYDLYKALLGPVEAAWKPAKTLVVVPHGALGFLPLSLLPTAPAKLLGGGQIAFASYRDVPWLARTHAVAVLPSVASLKALRGIKAATGARKPFVGFGDPYFNAEQAAQAAKEAPEQQMVMRGGKVALVRRNASRMAEADSTRLGNLPRLADTRGELLSLARATRAEASDVFLGKEANEQRVKTMPLGGYRVLAFATHGLIPGELDGLAEPALALSAPEVAGVAGDGLLTLAEVLSLKLDADWVVLSACNTAAGDGAGAEAVSGLGRAFFYAGARALLATNWPVHSASAARLTTELFRRQAENQTLARAEALRQAMLAVVDGKGFEDQGTGREVFSYAHPLFWAPFSLYGDGG